LAASRLRIGRALDHELQERVRDFQRDVRNAAVEAARVATERSRSQYTSELGGRPTIPPRPTGTRPTTEGTFAAHISWRPTADLGVELDIPQMEAAYPGKPWLWQIQEIGTGATAQQMRGGHGEQRAKGKHGNVSVATQVGRPIARGLVWSNPGGAIGAGQIIPGFWTRGGRARQIVIGREIKGKHFVRVGGRLGFHHYERSLMAAAHASFSRPLNRTAP
jgi:hypothetical protein